DLNLTQAQKDAIKTKMEADKPSDADREAMKAKRETMHKERTAKLETFASDTFDATAFVTRPADAANGPKVDRRAKKLAIITSVLDASQREKLAQKIEQGPQMREHGPRPEGAQQQGVQPQGVAPAPQK
ncbi:MAG: Spy/CpxP family protein refolding chaperone, partial [Polyangiaceae bacterium]